MCLHWWYLVNNSTPIIVQPPKSSASSITFLYYLLFKQTNTQNYRRQQKRTTAANQSIISAAQKPQAIHQQQQQQPNETHKNQHSAMNCVQANIICIDCHHAAFCWPLMLLLSDFWSVIRQMLAMLVYICIIKQTKVKLHTHTHTQTTILFYIFFSLGYFVRLQSSCQSKPFANILSVLKCAKGETTTAKFRNQNKTTYWIVSPKVYQYPLYV